MINKTMLRNTCLLMGSVLLLAACQKMKRPALGDYPQDTNPPGGPLKFYAAFDGTSSNPLMNAVDSIRASFPSDNPLASVDGISGKATKGAEGKQSHTPMPTTLKLLLVSPWRFGSRIPPRRVVQSFCSLSKTTRMAGITVPCFC